MEKKRNWLESGSLLVLLIFSSLLINKIGKLNNRIYLLGQGFPAPYFMKKMIGVEPTLLYVLKPSKCVGSLLEYKNLVNLPETKVVPLSSNAELTQKWILSMRIPKEKILLLPEMFEILKFYHGCLFPMKIVLFRGRIYLWECGPSETGDRVIKLLKLLKKEVS